MKRIHWVMLTSLVGALSLASCSEDTITSNRDSVGPTARMIYPKSTGESPLDISDSVDVYVAAKDNVGVARVTLWSMGLTESEAHVVDVPHTEPLNPAEVPDSLKPTDGSNVYRWRWFTSGIRNGTQVRLFAEVSDLAGNITRAAPSEVRIINAQERRPPRPTIILIDPTSGQGTTQTVFVFDASASQDDVYPPERIQVRWDFNNDGIWERDWDQNLVATDQVTYTFPRTGTYTVLVEAKNDYLNESATARMDVAVTNVGGNPRPPEPGNMSFVPSGTYSVGADSISQPHSSGNERPIHQARLTIGFFIERTEVSNRLFLDFLATAMVGHDNYPPLVRREGRYLMLYPDKVDPVEPDSLPRVLLSMDNSAIFYDGNAMTALPEHMDDPVVGVSWFGAKAYCENFGLRLPTEHEWEIAAKGDSAMFAYPWGYSISSDQANYLDSGYRALRPRDSYPSDISQFGLQNVAGNAAEWVKDWYGEYAGGTQINPEGPIFGTDKVVRGGSYLDSATGVRVTARDAFEPEGTSEVIGFRTAFTDTTRSR